MKRLQPLFLKTYGKKARQESAWILPENRKAAFDSSRSTDGDSSVLEAQRYDEPRRRAVGSP